MLVVVWVILVGVVDVCCWVNGFLVVVLVVVLMVIVVAILSSAVASLVFSIE